MSKLRISLVQERTDQIYFTGSSITGSLLLSVTEPKDYKHVSIRFGGKAHVHWTEGSGENSTSYNATEPYIDEKIILWSSDQSPDGKLDPGEYNWPFTFTIPSNVPSSFEGTAGNIRYSLEGRIGTGLMKFDHKVEVRIPVQQVVSITDPQLLEPVRQEVCVLLVLCFRSSCPERSCTQGWVLYRRIISCACYHREWKQPTGNTSSCH